MKKKIRIISLFVAFTLCLCGLFGCNKKSEDAEGFVTVRLNEVVRSVFYAPMYVAINEGFFEEEGIKIDLSTGFDTDSIAKLAERICGSSKFELPVGHNLTVSEFQFQDIFHYDVNGKGIDVSTMSAAEIVLAGIDYLITAVDAKRSELGAIQNRLESTIRNQENIYENVSDSRSQIRDADYAEEVSNMTAAQILQQGSVTILTQANSKPQIALQMLQES